MMQDGYITINALRYVQAVPQANAEPSQELHIFKI